MADTHSPCQEHAEDIIKLCGEIGAAILTTYMSAGRIGLGEYIGSGLDRKQVDTYY